MRKLRVLVTAVAATGLLLTTALPASADNVQNDVAVNGGDTFAAGGSTDIGYRISANNGDGESSCNATVASPATVTINVPTNVTVTPSSRTFTSCGTFQEVTFSSSTPGTYEITVSVADSGPGTYNVQPAKFALTVTESADTTPPVITKAVTGNEGLNGWYTSNVTVAWQVSDPESDATLTGCGTQTFSDDTASVVSSCSATSEGGTSSDSVTLKIDKTGPSAVLTPSGTLGSNGWYTSNVVVATSGADATSGPVTCSGEQTFSSETAGTTVNGSCTNQAGLSTSATALSIKIDKTGPSAVLTPNGTTGSNDWFTSNVTVGTSGSDGMSGGVTCSSPQTLSTETTGTEVTGSCTNAAGLTTAAAPIIVKIDKTSPTAALSITSGTLGQGGWYTTPVTVATNGADTVSEPVTCTGPQTLSRDTTGQVVNGSCQNHAGLSQNATPVTVKIDQSAPTNVVLTPSGTLGSNGWYTSDVSVTTTGEDSISGVTCTTVQSFIADSSSITVNGSCTNGAGQTTHATPITIKIDKSAPTNVLLTPAGTAGTNGWFTSNVTVSTSGEDAVSGVTCTAPQDLTSETGGTEVNGSCTNGAGLTTPAAPITVKIDKSAPTNVLLTPSGTAGTNGWFTGNVTVATAGTDALSGVTCTPDQDLTTETAGTEVEGSCTNGAGLTTPAAPITVKIDKTAPTATMVLSGTKGANDWWVTAVTAATTGSDPVSEPVVCTPATQTQSADTTGVTLSSTCTNDAGLTTSDSEQVKVDTTGPQNVAITGGPANGSQHYFGSVPAAPSGCTATDATSGFASCDVGGYSTTVGTHTLEAKAYDNAGNLTVATSTYTVKAWEKGGFFQPVDMGGVLNTVKNGSTVPLKFKAFAGSTELTSTSVVDYFVVDGVPCPGSTTPTDDIELVTTGGTQLRYDSSGGQFIQNWQTPKKAGACYRVSVVFDDGGAIGADFRLK